MRTAKIEFLLKGFCIVISDNVSAITKRNINCTRELVYEDVVKQQQWLGNRDWF